MSVGYWEKLQRRGISRKTVEYIMRQRDLEIPVRMIISRLRKRREVDRKTKGTKTDFQLSEGQVWAIIYRHRRFLESQENQE